jgi:DNA-binding NarL/FixJ family response regulator
MGRPHDPLHHDPPRAVVADDDAFARRVTTSVLEGAGIPVIAEAANGADTIAAVEFHRPDLVVMDVFMPEPDGIAATQHITERWPDTVVILLTGGNNQDVALRGLRAGAAGHLSKDVALEALPRAVLAALDGEAAISRTLAMRLVEDLRRGHEDGAHIRPIRSSLTAREWEVLDLICDGKSNDEIAAEFVVSTETIRTHVKHVLRKLDVHSRQQAVVAARALRER